MIRRLELMKWLNTCPDRNWEVVHEDEGHMRVLFIFDDEDDDDLVLSDHERKGRGLSATFGHRRMFDWIEYLAEKGCRPINWTI